MYQSPEHLCKNWWRRSTFGAAVFTEFADFVADPDVTEYIFARVSQTLYNSISTRNNRRRDGLSGASISRGSVSMTDDVRKQHLPHIKRLSSLLTESSFCNCLPYLISSNLQFVQLNLQFQTQQYFSIGSTTRCKVTKDPHFCIRPHFLVIDFCSMIIFTGC